jgi:signal transduction histidine kinase
MDTAHVLVWCALLCSAVLLRRQPIIAIALTLISAFVVGVGSEARQAVMMFLAAGVAAVEVCYIAATRPHRRSLAAAGLVIAGIVAAWLIPAGGLGFSHQTAVVAAGLMAVIAWLIGNSIRQSHAHNEALRLRTAADAVTAERLRIARELHDMVAHSIGIIAIQAGAGGRVIDSEPDQARDALAAIEVTSRETLAGLRRMLTGLRRAEPEVTAGAAPLDPMPGLADIERLAEMTLDAGVLVDLHWQGSRAPLPSDIDLSAYRIIQEAITNVVRHAGTGQCRVSIDQDDDQVSIEVTDEGRGGLVSATGFGIVGMRERTGLLGGEFSAGPRPGGGFRVAARLPVPVPAR